MGTKRSVSISNSSIEFAESRFDELSWSPIINGAIADLDYLLRACLPVLKPEEWLPILNAYNGHFFDNSLQRSTGLNLASCIMDDHGALSLDELPEEYREPVLRISRLTRPEQFAVLDVVRRYWVAATAGKLRGDTLAEQIKVLTQSRMGNAKGEI